MVGVTRTIQYMIHNAQRKDIANIYDTLVIKISSNRVQIEIVCVTGLLKIVNDICKYDI